MDAISLMKNLGELGARYRPSDIGPAILYFTSMINDGRVIVTNDESGIFAVFLFSVTDDFEPFINKGLWEYKPHNPNDTTIYFEKLISKGWNKELRKMVEAIVLKLYPQLEYGVWHRDASWGDRKVITKRRLQHV